MTTPLKRELPLLVVEIALLVVLLHANAPEVWFWFGVLLVLLVWRSWAWTWRHRERLQQRLQDPAVADPAPGSTSGRDTGAPG
jgi:hypothetical protein